jgi:hypothetical protein
VTARLRLVTAGLPVDVEDQTERHLPALLRAAGLAAPADAGASSAPPAVRIVVEQARRPFDTRGHVVVTRGVSTDDRAVVLHSVGGSGFSQRWDVCADHVTVRSRWTPGRLELAASALRSRHDALRAQVLLHHPALWWAGTLGLAPLHVSVVELDGVVVALAGPGGVGKSTLVADALASGARATCDNVGVSDGTTVFGLRESLRLDGSSSLGEGVVASGHRTTHGRRESSWAGQVPALRPDLLVVVRRGNGPRVRSVGPETAQRALVAGTFAAGELRRFWTLAAVLGLATGRGAVLPEVDQVARALTSRLPCFELELGSVPGGSLRDLLQAQLRDVQGMRTAGAVQ